MINERGYEAATFQAIALRAGFSRPTMHYYFHTKDEIYEHLQREAYTLVAECIASAQQQYGLLKRLTAFVAAARASELSDGSMMRFIITSRFEQHRCPSLRGTTTAVSEAVAAFYGRIVDEAIADGEIRPDADAKAVVDMLYAVFWGMGFFAGFVHAPADVDDIAKQLNRMFRKGLLSSTGSGAAPLGAPVAVVDDCSAPGRTVLGPPRPLRAVAFGA